MRYEPVAGTPMDDGPRPGTLAVARAVKRVAPELLSLEAQFGVFNRRRIGGSQSWSLHAEGRAADFGVPRAHRGDKGLGWRIACALIAARSELHTMRVIWDGHIASCEREFEWRRLSSSSDQHHDHIHWEQTRRGSMRMDLSPDRAEGALKRWL